jgi:FKBP-type peptidyl-prolyl cis-trans isomerase FklB
MGLHDVKSNAYWIWMDWAQSMKKFWLLGLVASLMLAGCGESEEEKRFRAELIEKAVNDDTRRAGNAFLTENAKQPDVVTTASGLQYKVLTPGEGASPHRLNTVVVNYEGRRIDGFVFDSSYARNKPSEFPLQGVIKGWREALPLMKVGAVWEVYVPADLAYGATSPNEQIPANSTLIFKIELLEIKAESAE